MPRVGTAIFTDPDDYKAGFREARIELFFTGHGDFKSRLAWLELPNLHLLRSQENLPRIAYVSLAPDRVFVSFAMHFVPSTFWGGIELQAGDVIFHSRDERMHERTGGASDWAFISIAPEYLAKFGKALTGFDLVPPQAGQVLGPPAIATARLRLLHAKACRVAESKPEVIAHREVARALEQDLFHALVTCLTKDDAHEHTPTKQHHTHIMTRFEKALSVQPNRQLQMAELCEAIGVSERTLRICCAERLGMGPSQYIRLRRLNLVRAALRRANAEGSSIAQVAARYGFAEPGRFAVAYRSVFGETPSTTLRRSDSPNASAEFA